jgi:hypothetical protein
LVGKPEGNKPLGRTGCRWGKKILKQIKEIELEGVDWVHLAQDSDRWRALVNTAMNLRVS